MSNRDSPQTAATSADERFLAFVRTGDRQIMQGLVEEFTDRSYNLARRILGRAQGAEDVVQEAYLILVKTANRYDGSITFIAWLSRIVTSTAIDHLRQAQRYSKLKDSNQQGIAAVNNAATSDDPPDQPELEALRSALDALPELYRTPLTLHYFGGLNQSETAQAMGVPAGTIASQLSRGIEQLRSKLSRAGFAMTSAAIVTSLTGLPTYAAPPALSASVSLAAAGQKVGERLLTGKTSSLAAASGALKIAALGALAIVAAMTLSTRQQPRTIVSIHNQSPLGGVAWTIPGIIEAENFDVGGEGIAYHDTDAVNEGEGYRNDGVDINDGSSVATDPSHGGFQIGWTEAGEWLEYTVDVRTTGNYTIEARVSGLDTGGTFHIEFNGVDRTGQFVMPADSGVSTWTTLRKTGVPLSAGRQIMKIALDSLGTRDWEVANLNYIRFAAE
jgi:RNA polymerase sigma factor (sigma-70 family)